MPQLHENHRPPLLQPTDSYNSLAIAQIVSPIVPLKMSEDMRQTLRISEAIRQQQSQLIALSNSEKRESPLPLRSSDLATTGESDASHETPDMSPTLAVRKKSLNLIESVKTEIKETDKSENTKETEKSEKSEKSHDTTGNSTVNTILNGPAEDVEMADSEPSAASVHGSAQNSPTFDRLALLFGRKKLKRDRAPGPLQIPNHARGVAPAINSAPIRTYYTGFPANAYTIPTGYPGRGPHPVRMAAGPHGNMANMGNMGNMGGVASVASVASVAPVAPLSGASMMPRRVMRPFVQPVAYPNVHVVQTPLRRNIPIVYERRVAKARGKERRKPVLDVFSNDLTREAPMNSQPPSAQREYFELPEEDRSNATEEEMKEMESKRQDLATILGTIQFNEEAAFNFKIFPGRETDAKEKFMKVCETTWDQYVLQSEGR